jgi:hypothetical protein
MCFAVKEQLRLLTDQFSRRAFGLLQLLREAFWLGALGDPIGWL